MTKDKDTWRDPIVEEVRRVRDEIAKECGYDIDKICEYLKSQRDKQASLGFKTGTPDTTSVDPKTGTRD